MKKKLKHTRMLVKVLHTRTNSSIKVRTLYVCIYLYGLVFLLRQLVVPFFCSVPFAYMSHASFERSLQKSQIFFSSPPSIACNEKKHGGGEARGNPSLFKGNRRDIKLEESAKKHTNKRDKKTRWFLIKSYSTSN